MATIVKFYKDGRNVKDITSIGYLPVDEDAVKDSRHLASSGSVIAAAALGEESMMTNLPIADSTLRFLFGDPDYDPTVAGVGSSGTWTKKNTKFTNVWDWTNTNTSWATAFGGGGTGIPGAFVDYENNPVKVIAAGDTSTVTNFSRLFQNCYAITEVCPIDTSGATNVALMFSYCENCTKFPDMDFSSATGDNTRAVFQVCKKMKVAPNIEFSTTNNYSLYNFFYGCDALIEVPLYDTSMCTNMSGLFSYNTTTKIPMSIKNIPEFDTGSVENLASMFYGCVNLESIPRLNTSVALSIAQMFNKCTSLKSLEGALLFDMSNMKYTKQTFCDCKNVESGALALYESWSQIPTITSHQDTFLNCGSDTESGRAELAQIPTSWGGTMEEEP